MKGVRTGVWMTGLNVGLVLLVAAGLVPGAILLLRQLAAEGARAQVQLAAVGALEGLRLQAEEVLTGARLLAERPTLQRLVREGRHAELATFLDPFRGTSRLDGCAVWTSAGVVAAVPPDAPWDALRAEVGEGVRYVALAASAPVVAARIPLQDGSGGAALAFRRLDVALEQQLATLAGMPVRIVLEKNAGDSVTRLAGGEWRARRFVPGTQAGVEVELPASFTTVHAVERRFVLVTCAAILAAIVAGTLVARHFSRPLRRLQEAALRIGGGTCTPPSRR